MQNIMVIWEMAAGEKNEDLRGDEKGERKRNIASKRVEGIYSI